MMKNLTPTRTVAAFALGLLLTAATASAQGTVKTVHGIFKSSDGDSGTYVRTVTTDDATVTFNVVYTRSSDQATSTHILTRTTDTTGNRAVTVSNTDFGATTAYTAQKTVTKEKHGQFVGQGTYTTADGDSGTLTTLESKGGPVDVTTDVHNSPTTGVTQILDLEDSELGFTAVKHIVLSPGGTVHTTVTTRYVTGGGKE